VAEVPQSANTPDILNRSPAEFAALQELATELKNPAFIIPRFATLGQRAHGEIWGKFVQLFMKEVQAVLVNGTTPGQSLVSTTDATPTTIATFAIAVGEAVSLDVEVFGKKASGDWVHTRIRRQYDRGAGGLAILDDEYDVQARYSSGGTLTTADAELVISGNNLLVQVTGEAASISWTAFHTIRRVTT
jgi:hypothetical protein